MDISKKDDTISLIEKNLRRVDYIVRIHGREIISDYDITVPQFSALQILIHHEDMTISELSQKMSLACSTITDLMDRMEAGGLVQRKKDDRDKRLVRIEVLQKGFDILDKVLEKRVQFLETVLQDFSEEEKQQLKNSLMKLHEAISTTD